MEDGTEVTQEEEGSKEGTVWRGHSARRILLQIRPTFGDIVRGPLALRLEVSRFRLSTAMS